MGRGDEGVTTRRVAADLQQATVALPEIHWRKGPGTEGSLSLLVELGADDRPLAYRDVVLQAGDLVARGNATPAGDGEGLAAIALERIAFGRSDLQDVSVVLGDDGVHAAIRTGTLDAEPFQIGRAHV